MSKEWEISTDAAPEGHYQASIIEDGERVAIAFGTPDNAALIAAAPDLLAALRDILDDLEAGAPVMDRFGSRAAIAKATEVQA